MSPIDFTVGGPIDYSQTPSNLYASKLGYIHRYTSNFYKNISGNLAYGVLNISSFWCSIVARLHSNSSLFQVYLLSVDGSEGLDCLCSVGKSSLTIYSKSQLDSSSQALFAGYAI